MKSAMARSLFIAASLRCPCLLTSLAGHLAFSDAAVLDGNAAAATLAQKAADFMLPQSPEAIVRFPRQWTDDMFMATSVLARVGEATKDPKYGAAGSKRPSTANSTRINESVVLRLPLLLLFFAGGCAALIYELVWFYLVELVVGASSISIAVLLASFMGGMAIGSALLPRVVSPARHPLRVIAALELGIGAIGLLMPFAMPLVQAGYVALAGFGHASVLLRALVCALVMLPPTMLMGATLPAIARWAGTSRTGSSTVGFLYMANIAGAAFGTVLAGFYLLRVYDTVIASLVAVGFNALAASIAWWIASRYGHTARAESMSVSIPAAGSRLPVPVYIVAGLSGLTALGAEVVWTRQLSLLFGASVYNFSLILAVFLVGLGLGSFAGATIAKRTSNPSRALGVCQLLLVLAIAFGAMAIVDVLPQWRATAAFLPQVRASIPLTFAYDAARCAFAFLPATLLWGASFPLAVAAAATGRNATRSVSRVNAINTLGSLVGALGFTLVGIPYLGSQRAQQALAVFAAISSATLLLWTPRRPNAPGKATPYVVVAALLAVTGMAMAMVPAVPGRLIAFGRSVDSWPTIKQFLYLKEGAVASIAVTVNTSGAKQFHIAGKVEASDMDIDMRLERMLGHVPALAHPHPRKILIVGNGAGVTAGALAVHPEVERIVICEIERMVPPSARQFFGKENHHVLDDLRTQVVFDDARHFLMTTKEKFDIITSDPIHPWVRGAATLYSLEYLQLVRDHLEPGGIVTQWIPLYETNVRSVKSELGTFARVFPDTTLWNPDLLEEGYDLVAMGRLTPATLDEAVIQQRLDESPAVRQSLSEVTLTTAGALLSTYAGRAVDLAPWLADAEINRERQLRLQYLAGLAANTDERYLIFQSIVKYRRYPADLFAVSAELEGQLRRWYSQ
ncbi:MAG: fused MFS/spermidine synthase [Vicinamibacterales bacterium]